MSRFILQFEFDFHANGWDHAIALIKYADTLGIDTAAAATTHYTPTPNSAAPAAKPPPAKAAPPAPKAAPAPKTAAPAKPKAAPSKPTPPPAKDDALDLNGGGDDDEEATGGLGLGDMFDDAAEDFKGTPEEAKEDALARLRVMLGNGHKVQVKEIQQIMRVAKFHDVPPEQGFDFLKRVKAVEAKIAARH